VLIISTFSQIIPPTAIALGNFDGVHRGHQCVIQPVLAGSDLAATVVTFDPHPQEFFSQSPRLLLTPDAEKIDRLAQMGVKQLVLLPFTAAVANLTAAEFMQQILIEQLQAQFISVGFDFRFGRQRQGSVEDLQRVWGDRICIVPEQLIPGIDRPVRISSSAIREALSQGEVELANTLLGYPYRLAGKVVTGNQMGRELGFPTANLQLHIQKFLPRDGVYAVKVLGIDPEPLLGVMNIGVRPTVTGGQQRTVEVHLLNWRGDLYGKEIMVDLLKFIRPEQKFADLEQLKQQIQVDCAATLNLN